MLSSEGIQEQRRRVLHSNRPFEIQWPACDQHGAVAIVGGDPSMRPAHQRCVATNQIKRCSESQSLLEHPFGQVQFAALRRAARKVPSDPNPVWREWRHNE